MPLSLRGNDPARPEAISEPAMPGFHAQVALHPERGTLAMTVRYPMSLSLRGNVPDKPEAISIPAFYGMTRAEGPRLQDVEVDVHVLAAAVQVDRDPVRALELAEHAEGGRGPRERLSVDGADDVSVVEAELGPEARLAYAEDLELSSGSSGNVKAFASQG
jgi:hypothetical protein